MFKIFCEKSFAFDNGEKDKQGRIVEVKAPMGFNSVPDWVAKTDLYKLAVAEGSIKPYKAMGESEAVLKAAERETALNQRIKELEEQLELANKKPAKLSKKELTELTKQFKDRLSNAKDEEEATSILAEAVAAGVEINPDK